MKYWRAGAGANLYRDISGGVPVSGCDSSFGFTDLNLWGPDGLFSSPEVDELMAVLEAGCEGDCGSSLIKSPHYDRLKEIGCFTTLNFFPK